MSGAQVSQSQQSQTSLSLIFVQILTNFWIKVFESSGGSVQYQFKTENGQTSQLSINYILNHIIDSVFSIEGAVTYRVVTVDDPSHPTHTGLIFIEFLYNFLYLCLSDRRFSGDPDYSGTDSTQFCRFTHRSVINQ